MAPTRCGHKHHSERGALRVALTSSGRTLASNDGRGPSSEEVPNYRA